MTSIPVIHRSKPVTVQIEEILRERIQRGAYPPGKRMPSEAALAVELQVSRASVRTALAGLAAEGYLQRRHGDGTYPSPRAMTLGFSTGKMWDIIRQIQDSGRQATLKILEQAYRPASTDESQALNLAADELVLSMRRLFLAGDRPVALISNVVRSAGLDPNLPADAAALAPLDFLARFCRQKPGTSTVSFNAILADEETSATLALRKGDPLLKMSGVLFDETGAPIMFETEIYPGEEGFQMQAGSIRS